MVFRHVGAGRDKRSHPASFRRHFSFHGTRVSWSRVSPRAHSRASIGLTLSADYGAPGIPGGHSALYIAWFGSTQGPHRGGKDARGVPRRLWALCSANHAGRRARRHQFQFEVFQLAKIAASFLSLRRDRRLAPRLRALPNALHLRLSRTRSTKRSASPVYWRGSSNASNCSRLRTAETS